MYIYNINEVLNLKDNKSNIAKTLMWNTKFEVFICTSVSLELKYRIFEQIAEVWYDINVIFYIIFLKIYIWEVVKMSYSAIIIFIVIGIFACNIILMVHEFLKLRYGTVTFDIVLTTRRSSKLLKKCNEINLTKETIAVAFKLAQYELENFEQFEQFEQHEYLF